MLKALVLTGLSASAVLGVSAPAQAATTCGSLPAQVQGSPNVRPGQAGTTYLWHDVHGWKLRVTHPGTAKVVVSGTITATRDISHLTRVLLEPGDVATVSPDGHTLAFRFTNVGHVDGVNFTAECSHALRVTVKGASTQQIRLGAHRVHPTSVPFTIERH